MKEAIHLKFIIVLPNLPSFMKIHKSVFDSFFPAIRETNSQTNAGEDITSLVAVNTADENLET